MPEELEPRYGSFYCPRCRETFYYRTHVVVGSPDNEVYKCPECEEVMYEVRVEQFMDNSEEILYAMKLLEDELQES